jgi:hypothetical protein
MPVVVVAVLLIIAVLPAWIAARKGRGFWTWYVFGLLLWIVAVPAALLAGDARRRCPYCAEHVQQQAIACGHCGRRIGRAHPRGIAVDPNER